MYREIREITDEFPSLELHLGQALLAEDTGTISQEAGAAQAIAVSLLDRLRGLLAGQSEHGADWALVEAAVSALNHGWSHAEKVALGTSAAEMRACVIDFKADVDRADAYLRVAAGAPDES